MQPHIGVTLKSAGRGQTTKSFVATGRSLIHCGLPLLHTGVAYITSEIQWYSPLTRNEGPQGRARPWIYSWRLFPLTVRHTPHPVTRLSNMFSCDEPSQGPDWQKTMFQERHPWKLYHFVIEEEEEEVGKKERTVSMNINGTCRNTNHCWSFRHKTLGRFKAYMEYIAHI